MKNHLATIILLILAVIAFCIGFQVSETYKTACDVVAFALPTIAAVVELVLSERSSKQIEEELKKRPPVEVLSEEEYKRRQAEGTIDEKTIYATTEE